MPIIQSFAQLEKNYGKEGADVIIAVSYTHLDVYKRQMNDSAEKFYESLEQNNLFDSPDEDENMGMGGMLSLIHISD